MENPIGQYVATCYEDQNTLAVRNALTLSRVQVRKTCKGPI